MTRLRSDSAPDYAALSPEHALDLLEAAGLRGDGRVLQLNSFENRVFQVYLEDGGAVVAKFYRPGRWSDAQLLEEHAFASQLAAAEVPVAAPLPLRRSIGASLELLGEPPTLARHAGAGPAYRFAVAPSQPGRAPELDQPDVRRRIGRFIARLHDVGASRRFTARLTFDVATFGQAARDAVLASGLLGEAAHDVWLPTCDAALQRCRQLFDTRPAKTMRLHGDCHRGNVLWTDGPHFVDLDDACSGPAIQDLWMLLDGDRASMRAQLTELLAGYEEMRRFDLHEVALIEPLRTLRMIHHSAWIARRWHDPAFPLAFPWFGSGSYWSQQAADLRDQLDAMNEPPLLD